MNFYEKYFLINLKDYPNIGIDLEINKILLYVLIGAMLAVVMLGYRKAGIARVIKSLLRHEAKDEGSAKTLDELKINTLCARVALISAEGRIAKVIRRVGAHQYTYEEYIAAIKKKKGKTKGEDTEKNKQSNPLAAEKINFSTAKFYICEEKTEEATRIYDRTESPVLHTILTCVLLLSLYTCLLFAMPGLLDVINASMS